MAIGLGAVPALLIFVPRWTAGKAEAKRKTDFEAAISREIPANLPLCPLPGPERDIFLAQRAAALSGSRNLWVPVCRIAILPAHRILVMATTRAELNDCKLAGPAKSISACILEEPLGFLADAAARRTWARHESGSVIWMTAQSMAWQDHLIVEHRQWVTLGLLLVACVVFLCFALRRARQAWVWREACHGPGEPDVPRNAELLLHWVLGQRCRSLPGDLGQEYALMLESGFSRREAGRWYRWQVFHSIAPVTARHVESILTRRFEGGVFKRRG